MTSEWSLEIEDMSWVENTAAEVDFVLEALELRGGERVLDLACGFGRHSLELARRGYLVVGVDFTEAYVMHARSIARDEHLDNAEFLLADVRDVSFHEEFDAVLNMADGAIGYFDTDEENLRLFDVIGAALKPGGRHVMGICSAAHAASHFPKRHWEAGSRSLSLADFRWNAASSRMLYRGHVLKYGEQLDAGEQRRFRTMTTAPGCTRWRNWRRSCHSGGCGSRRRTVTTTPPSRPLQST